MASAQCPGYDHQPDSKPTEMPAQVPAQVPAQATASQLQAPATIPAVQQQQQDDRPNIAVSEGLMSWRTGNMAFREPIEDDKDIFVADSGCNGHVTNDMKWYIDFEEFTTPRTDARMPPHWACSEPRCGVPINMIPAVASATAERWDMLWVRDSLAWRRAVLMTRPPRLRTTKINGRLIFSLLAW